MKIENKTIIPGQGLGSLKFGMDKSEVEAICGKPDEIEHDALDEDDEDVAEAWHYDDLEMSVSFEDIDGWKLVSIAVSGEEYTLDGISMIGMNKAEALETMKKLNAGPFLEEPIEEDEEDIILISFEEAEINLWFDSGILSEIQWGPK